MKNVVKRALTFNLHVQDTPLPKNATCRLKGTLIKRTIPFVTVGWTIYNFINMKSFVMMWKKEINDKTTQKEVV